MVWYFSATGNSERIAKSLAEQLGEEVAPIEASTLIDTRHGERTVIVTPVFYFSAPEIVLNCLHRSTFQNDDVLHVVFTSGKMPGGADHAVREAAPNATVLCHHVSMLTNYIVFYKIPKQPEVDNMLAGADQAFKKIMESIVSNVGTYASESWWKHVGIPARWLFRMHTKTRRFTATNRCNSCGICVKGCPVGAIRLIDGHPQWVKERCEHCLKCLHRCPTLAIEYGKSTRGKDRYVYPRVISNR